MRIAIVTGASAGLGAEFVRQIDARGEVEEIWMLARRLDRMEVLGRELKRATPRCFAVDLAKSEEIARFAAVLEAERPDVRWLVNNAGFGAFGTFEEIPLDRQLEMVDLNVRALLDMTGRVLPWISKGGRILQVASSGGFWPLPGLATYTATKAFVVAHAQALWAELSPKGIQVTVVCPGPVRTEFVSAATRGARTEMPGARADAVVRVALRHSDWGWIHSVYGWSIKALIALSPLTPRNAYLLLTRYIPWWKQVTG